MSAFRETRWSLLGAAQGGDAPAQEALVKLYLPPVIRYLRASGAGQDAEDLAQEVFLRLFHRDVLARADPHAGRFRSLLLAVARNVLRGERTKAQAQKRGGGRELLSLEEDQVPQAEREAFDREWLLSLLERAIERLAQEHPTYHEAMCLSLRGQAPAEIARSLERKPKDVRNHLHRARKALARYLHEDAWNYTASPNDHATELGLLSRLLPPNTP